MPGIDHPVRISDLVLQWHPDWLTVCLLVAVVAVYVRARRRIRARGVAWGGHRDLAFVAGVLLTAWVTCGFPQARASQLMWVFTAQQLLLLLVLPVILVAAQPVGLAKAAYGPEAALARLTASRAARVAGHPAVTLVYVPLMTWLLFFAGVGELAVRSTPAGWVLHVVVLLVGAVIALPLVQEEDDRSSLAVGAAIAVGAVELLLDAVPGIVLRLETHLMMPAFAVGRPSWSPSWLSDQQLAGTILWTVAELLDLPFLVLAFRQWLRVERRETSRIDAELDRAAAASAGGVATGDDAPAATRPWWMDHPELRRRYGAGG